jgi:uncharacterized RmlC-like cupin family protein
MTTTDIDVTGSIHIVNPGDFSTLTAQTPGAQRLAAIAAQTGVRSAMWGGLFIVEAGARTAIHHHGAQETIAYVLEGTASLQWGERGEFQAVASAGSFLCVPPYLPHREMNEGSRPFRWVVVRSTPEPIVVNLPDDFWDREGEEPGLIRDRTALLPE